MASSQDDPPTKASPTKASKWSSLINRSLEAWIALDRPPHNLAETSLQSFDDLEDFLDRVSTSMLPMFWFFQRREAFMSQKTMTKWDRDRLDDYILLPAFPGFVTRDECLFVSHFWHTHGDPDPGGKYLRLMQKDLEVQEWSYIWLDWTCLPQEPWSGHEAGYFRKALRTVPGIIRNCGFMWYYPGFEPRLWILYEVAEYVLTCEGSDQHMITEDIKEFMNHVKEMLEIGVGATLAKYKYKYRFERDRKLITPWMELLVLLHRLHIDLDDIRRIQDGITWFRNCDNMIYATSQGTVIVNKFCGVLTLRGEQYNFTPFPQTGKFSTSSTGFYFAKQDWIDRVDIPGATEAQEPSQESGRKTKIEQLEL
jgi:hypothetical protein